MCVMQSGCFQPSEFRVLQGAAKGEKACPSCAIDLATTEDLTYTAFEPIDKTKPIDGMDPVEWLEAMLMD